MFVDTVNYKTQSYIVKDIKRGLTEKDIMLYFEKLGYMSIKSYVSHIKGNKKSPLLKGINISKDISKVFKSYKSGYPDFLLVKDNTIRFVEVKLDNDSLRSNQLLFLQELSKYADVTVAYFNNLEVTNEDEFKSINNFKGRDKLLVEHLEKLIHIQEEKGFKPYWVIAKLYESFEKRIYSKKLLPIISKELNISKESIFNFTKNNLDSSKSKINPYAEKALEKKKTIRNSKHNRYKRP